MRTLYLVRHGETAWNAERRLQGQADIDLAPCGEAQVAALRPVLAASLDAEAGEPTVVTSPLARAVASARLLGLAPDLVDPRWQEADLGTWTGRTRAELVAEGDGYAAWRRGELDPPGAEDRAAVRRRVGAAIAALADREVVVVTTHGGAIRAALAHLVGLEAGNLVPVQPASLTILDLDRARPRLRAYNLTPLAGAAVGAEPTD